MIGRTLLHYEITGRVGAGGMGEVYLARDTTLGREVALKLLPAELAGDASRVARLQREAALLASLNHPNVATLYGLENADDSSFIVMEYVPGEDLANRISRGAVPVSETIAIGRQVADSLAAAHDKGIIHRDLKPGNIRVTPDGTVKVLDFGLAKAFGADGEVSDLSNSPTIMSADRTAAGVILGTAGYMSPEQARGKTLDARTDVWSFGCVMYECLTGQVPFKGDTVTDVLARILEREPDWEALPPDTSPALRMLLRRCLEKDRRRRWRDFNDIAVLLDETPALAASPTVNRPVARRSPAPWIAAAALVVVAGITSYFAGASRRAATMPEASGTPTLSFTPLTLQSGRELEPSISPDGDFIVYSSGESGNSDIFLQRIGGQKPINLTENSRAPDYAPAYSPDGGRIAFHSDRADGGVFVMGSTGESVKKVSDIGHDPAWSPDGRRLVVSEEYTPNPYGRDLTAALWVIDLAGGNSEKIFDGDAVQPDWSPNGRRIAYWFLDDASGGRRDIATIGADGEDRVVVTQDAAVDWNPKWSSDGRYLYFLSDRAGSMNLWRVRIDQSTGKVLGGFEQMTAPTASAGRFAMSTSGRIAYESITPGNRIMKIAFDPRTEAVQTAEVVLEGSLMCVDPRVSPDGEWVAFRSSGTQEDIYLIRPDGRDIRKLTDDAAKDRGPSWSADGKRIYFYSDRSGRYEIHRINMDGSGLEQVTKTTGRSLWYPIVNDDETRMAATNELGVSLIDISGSLPVQTEAVAQNLPPPGSGLVFWAAEWSADSRRLLGTGYAADGSSFDEIYIYDLDSKQYTRYGENLKQVGGAAWLPGGRRMIAFADGSLILIDSQSGNRRVLGADLGLAVNSTSLPRDGSMIYYANSESQVDIWLATAE